MSKQELMNFEYEGRPVRMVLIDNEPWFVLADVCSILQVDNVTDVSARLDDDEKTFEKIEGFRGPSVTLVNEPGLYRVIMRSSKPVAKVFQRWIMHDVLPQIRKAGGYGQPKLTPSMITDGLLIALGQRINENERYIEQQRELIAQMEPKANYCDRVLQSAEPLPITIIAKDYGMSGQALNRMLHDLGVQYQCDGTWVLHQRYADLGYTKTRTYTFTHSDGTPGTRVHTYWTQAGRRFLVDMLADEGIYPLSETAERNTLYFENVTVTYTINGARAPCICANVTNWRQTLIDNGIVTSAVKAAAKEFSPTDVANRTLVEPRVQEILQDSMDKKYGVDTVFINKVTVAEVEFEESYQTAIEDKQRIQMEYEQQQIANQKSIEKAEADAEVQRTNAEAEADAARIRAEGEADANRTIADSLSKDILRNKYHENWNGQLPQVVSSGGVGAMIEIPILESAAPTATASPEGNQ